MGDKAEVMIEATELTKYYGTLKAIDSVGFTLHRGEVLGFLGPNGAGKTTTMKILTCYFSPSSGRFSVKGLDGFKSPGEIKKIIGYLPENAPLYGEMTPQEYLDFIASIRAIPPADIAKKIKDIAEVCGLSSVMNQEIRTLSKGYRQRVGLAGALIHKPPVLILDEPTVGLDPNQIIKVRELITELGRDHTVVLSTHILPEVEQVCERVFIIDRGRIVADGAPDALRTKLIGNPMISVELRGADATACESLARVPGVVGVEPRSEGSFLVEYRGDADPREAIFHLAVERGWVLLGLTREQATLEDVFVRLTTADEMKPTPASVGEEV